MAKNNKKISKLVLISSNNVTLLLTRARGKIRIADGNGNHIRRPTEAKNDRTYFIEWMITNDEVGQLAKKILNEKR